MLPTYTGPALMCIPCSMSTQLTAFRIVPFIWQWHCNIMVGKSLVGQGPDPAHGTDPGTYCLFGNIAGPGATNGLVYLQCVTVEELRQLGGNSSVTYGAYNGGGIQVFTAYIGPKTQKCRINAQHIPDSPRTGLSLNEPHILLSMQIMNPFQPRLFDMRVYDGERTDT